MKIKVKVFGYFRELARTDGIEVELTDEVDIISLLAQLSKLWGQKFLEAVLDVEKGTLKPYVSVLVNGRDVMFLQGLKTKLKGGEIVAILPPAIGGY